jgi:hypothetical protein
MGNSNSVVRRQELFQCEINWSEPIPGVVGIVNGCSAEVTLPTHARARPLREIQAAAKADPAITFISGGDDPHTWVWTTETTEHGV